MLFLFMLVSKLLKQPACCKVLKQKRRLTTIQYVFWPQGNWMYQEAIILPTTRYWKLRSPKSFLYFKDKRVYRVEPTPIFKMENIKCFSQSMNCLESQSSFFINKIKWLSVDSEPFSFRLSKDLYRFFCSLLPVFLINLY